MTSVLRCDILEISAKRHLRIQQFVARRSVRLVLTGKSNGMLTHRFLREADIVSE